MSPKKVKIKNKGLKDFQSLIKKNLKIDKINPLAAIEETKSKIGNFYENLNIIYKYFKLYIYSSIPVKIKKKIIENKLIGNK